MSKLFEAMGINGKIDDDNGCPWFDADCDACPYNKEDRRNEKCSVVAWNDVNDFILKAMEGRK